MIISANARRLVKNPLRLEHGAYQMDFEHLESVAADPENSLLILCNPHNPIGRVWPKRDLSRLAEICAANNVFVIADEIHGDITYQRNYTPLASISNESSLNCATCISPIKSFNLAGVANSMIVIDDEQKRSLCKDRFSRLEINKNNVFSTAAMLAAYTDGESWLDQVIAYLDENIVTVRRYLQQRVPLVKLVAPEGTYLLWLDFRSLGLDARQLEKFLVHRAGIAGNPGHWFGREGAGFARINIACPRRYITEALGRLEIAVRQLSENG
jgi:cystathionine beta-lyase